MATVRRLQVLLYWLFLFQHSVFAQVFLPIPGTEGKEIRSIQELGGAVWLQTNEGAYRWANGNAALVEGTERKVVRVIQELGGAVWLRTNEGAYRWANGTATLVEGTEGKGIGNIQELGGVVWLQTGDGVYWWANGKATLVKGTEGNYIKRIQELSGAVWIPTGEGAYRWANGKATIVEGTEGKKIGRIEEIGGAVWLQMTAGVCRWANGKATLVEGTEGKRFGRIEEIGGAVWLRTAGGVYRWANGKATLVEGTEGKRFGRIEEIGGAVWLQMAGGVYRWANGKAILVEGTEGNRFWRIQESGNAVWLRTTKRAYRWANGKTTLVEGTGGKRIGSIQELGGAVWLPTTGGMFWWTNGKAALVEGTEGKEIRSFLKIGDAVWIYTSGGVFRWTNGKATLVEGTEGKGVGRIQELGGAVWLQTDEGAYRWANGKTTLVEGTEGKGVGSIQEIGGLVWLQTDEGAYRWANGKTTLVEGTEGKGVDSIQEIGDAVWLSTNEGAYRWANGKTTLVEGTEGKGIDTIQEIGDAVWLQTTGGVYRWANGKAALVEGTEGKGTFSIQDLGGDVFFTTEDEDAFVIFEAASLSFTPPKINLSGPLVPQFNYQGLPHRVQNPNLVAIVTTSEEQFKRDKNDMKTWQYPDRINVELKPGWNRLHWFVKDRWGNWNEGVHPVWIWPRGKALAILGGTFWLVLLLLILLLAPHVTYCHQLLMNPFLRKVGSFGLVPLFISVFPPCRRHLLKRYHRAIRGEGDFAQWRDRFIIPEDRFLPNRFGADLDRSRALFLQGQSGIGKTSFLQFLSYRYAAGVIDRPKRGVPVFVPLKIYQQSKPEEMVLEQLEKYGLLTDTSLNNWLLKQGGFLIFFDGLNEIDDPAKRLAVSKFIDRYRLVNCFVVSSQKTYTDFKLQEVPLVRLTRDKILAFLQAGLENEDPEAITADFDASMWTLYGIPHNLEMGIRVWRSRRRFPANHQELFGAVLDPIYDRWQEAGEGSYTATLEAHAFHMISTGEHRFDPTKTLPAGIRQALLENKILVQRNEQVLFVHDLVRASLAARYLQREWRTVCQAADLTLNQNWLPMLEPLTAVLDKAECRELTFLVLEKSVDLARDVFKHLHQNYPDKCRSWKSEFEARLGAALTREDTRAPE
ncbi:MAG: hypothetical protein QNK37_00945 [Acidobacteriota bacterium]|nr:hypothetical protein [Acidobacteriota bacterium]